MKNTIYLMEQTLEQHHLEDHIPDNERKNPSSKSGNNHALLAISFSLNSCMLDSRTTHHMSSSDRLLSYLDTCFIPPMFMGDDSSAKV
jgi:hypothetical protein